ncbi:hypothetical protein M501DRAFT_941944 [Patellaria atrata CBS 101060]|uniref:RBR-type E3 ubiquitin transferase n=1 Tax=Patellaria atrata CBS 101060 TaxID=1346257 RepID=A0A9P4S4X9_9PEZI|nr:hypothetical protein M501DRAFT_941944 [Patellaria atrata CBS 101060]
METTTTSQPIDPASLHDCITILTLELQEVEISVHKSKGKRAIDDPSDFEVARTLYQAEIQSQICVLKDNILAHSIASAVDADGKIITIHEETQAQQDRHFALQFDKFQEEIDSPPVYVADVPRYPFGRHIEGANFLPVGYDLSDDEENNPGPSVPYLRRQAQKFQTTHQCVVCVSDYPFAEIIRLQCGHIYCRNCLKDLFMRSTKDQSLFPPRCCKETISIDAIEGSMSDEEKETFTSAKIEFTSGNRTYCSNNQCGKFILPEQYKVEIAECQHCYTQTCIQCKGQVHDGECPDDVFTQATLQLGRDLGWQRCYQCRMLVSLDRGCYHMTCLCKAEFCYHCGVEWKNCTCDRWDEQNLMERVDELVQREAHQPLPVHERNRTVEAMRQEILETHECNHPGRFERIFDAPRRGFRCEICYAHHWKYILQCRRCHIRACEECRRHRT